MPTLDQPVIGNFCWVEANLDDPQRGKSFYEKLFGWRGDDMQMPDGAGVYTLLKLGENQVAGLLKLPEAAKKMGAPSHWLSYVAVSDIAAATQKAEGLGARVLLAPKPVGSGMMSVIADPTGAVLALWESKASMGSFVYGEDNTLCWNELATSDVEAAKKFYSSLFGWGLDPMPMGEFTYTVIQNHGDKRGIGGIMPKMHEGPNVWTVYFAVADCDQTAKKLSELGGKVVIPPSDIPNIGRFAVFEDDQGAAFAIIKGDPQQ